MYFIGIYRFGIDFRWSASWVIRSCDRVDHARRLLIIRGYGHPGNIAISASHGSMIHTDPLHLCLSKIGWNNWAKSLQGIQIVALWMESRVRAPVMTVTVLMAIVKGSTELGQYDIIEGSNSTLIRQVLLLHELHFLFFFHDFIKWIFNNYICTVNMFVLYHIVNNYRFFCSMVL